MNNIYDEFINDCIDVSRKQIDELKEKLKQEEKKLGLLEQTAEGTIEEKKTFFHMMIND